MNSINPKIAVLVLGYNDKNYLEDVIKSSLNQNYDNFELIYIDNLSTDGSLNYIKKNYPNIRIIRNNKNLGYAGAYKYAIEKIFEENFEGAVLLNPDVVLNKNWLLNLVKSSYADEKIAIAQSKIFLWDGKNNNLANTFGNKINYLGFGFCGNYKKGDNQEFSKDIEIAYASGCSMLIKKDCYLKIGGLDEKFFLYYEDQDIGWRARIKGYKVILSSKSIVYHKYKFHKGKTNRKKVFFLERNRLYFIFKNYSAKTIILIAPALIFMEIGIVLHLAIRGYFAEKIKGYYSIIKNIKLLYNDRKKIQKERIVSDTELFPLLNPTINFEEINSFPLKIVNLFLILYYKIVRNIV